MPEGQDSTGGSSVDCGLYMMSLQRLLTCLLLRTLVCSNEGECPVGRRRLMLQLKSGKLESTR